LSLLEHKVEVAVILKITNFFVSVGSTYSSFDGKYRSGISGARGSFVRKIAPLFSLLIFEVRFY
jgi:hypothetical protein